MHVLFRNISAPDSDSITNRPVVLEMVEHTFIYAGRSIVRGTFPLTLSWACTIHTVHGLTVSSCTLDVILQTYQTEFYNKCLVYMHRRAFHENVSGL